MSYVQLPGAEKVAIPLATVIVSVTVLTFGYSPVAVIVKVVGVLAVRSEIGGTGTGYRVTVTTDSGRGETYSLIVV